MAGEVEKKSSTIFKTVVKAQEPFVPPSEKNKFMQYHSGVSSGDLERLGIEFGVRDSRGLEHAERAKHVFGINGEEFKKVYDNLRNSGFGPSDKNTIGDKTIFVITSGLHKKFENTAFGLLLSSRKDTKKASDSDINRSIAIESELKRDSPLKNSGLNAYKTENKDEVISALNDYDNIKNLPGAIDTLVYSIKTSIPPKVLHESIRDLEGVEQKKKFLETVEKLMSRLETKKGAEATRRITLNKIKAFNKVKNDPFSREVFELSMSTGLNFNDLLKEVRRVGDEEELRKGIVRNFETFNRRVSDVFGGDFAERLSAKSTFEIGSELSKKGLSLDRMLKDEAVKKLFLATRFNRPFVEELKVKPLGFIPADNFARLYTLSRSYGLDFKKLVQNYGGENVKRNLSIILNEARGAKPLGLTYSNLMDRFRKLGIQTNEDKEVGLIAYNKGIPPERFARIKRDAESAGLHPFVLVDLLPRGGVKQKQSPA